MKLDHLSYEVFCFRTLNVIVNLHCKELIYNVIDIDAQTFLHPDLINYYILTGGCIF